MHDLTTQNRTAIKNHICIYTHTASGNSTGEWARADVRLVYGSVASKSLDRPLARLQIDHRQVDLLQVVRIRGTVTGGH